MDLKSLLELSLQWSKQLPLAPAEVDEESHFLHLLSEAQPPPSTIPRFFFPKRIHGDPISKTFNSVLRTRVLEHHQRNIPSNEAVEEFWELACSLAEDKQIGYSAFMSMREKVTAPLRPFITTEVFMRLQKDDNGQISLTDYFSYFDRKSSLIEARLEFAIFDADFDGHLTEPELIAYLQSQLADISLQEMYLPTASRKFFFFLDPSHRGKINITNIILSPILDEFFEFRESPHVGIENWFSNQCVTTVYLQFINLDLDRKGYLLKEDLYGYGNLTDIFIDRLFQVYCSELDYKGYLDFVLAMQNTDTPESISYCFKLLDVGERGYLDEYIVEYFFEAVLKKGLQTAREAGEELCIFDGVEVKHVVDEVFDMVNPPIDRCITLSDLLKCGVGGTVVSILTDYVAFETYENRENPPPPDSSE